MFEGEPSEGYLTIAFLPIDVVVEEEMEISEVSSEKCSFFPVNDVVFEEETGMFLRAGTLDLQIASEGEDVVADGVFLSIMLVEATVGRVIDDVLLREYVCASFIEINPPSAIMKSGDIVEEVQPDDCSRLNSQRINSSHIAEDGTIAV